MRPKDLFKFPYSIYCFSMFFNSGFLLSVFTLFFISKGLSMTQIALLDSVWALTELVFNVPFGIFSDKIGHKSTMAIAIGLQSMTMFLMAIANGLLWFLALFLLWGISSAMARGPMEALVYENSLALAQEYKVIRAKLDLFSSSALVVGTITGPLLFQISPGWPWVACGLSLLLALVFLWPLPEPSKDRRKFSLGNLGQTLKDPGILWACLYFGLLFSMAMCFVDLIEQPWLLLIGVPMAFLGVVIAISRFLPGTVLYFQDKHRLLDHDALIYGLGPFIWATVLYSFMTLKGFMVLPLYFAFFLVRDFNNVLYDNHIQTRLKDDVRASAYSFVELVISLVYGVMSVVIGHLIDLYDIGTGLSALVGLSIVLGLIGLLYGLWDKRKIFNIKDR